MIVVAIKKGAARSPACIRGGTKPIPNVVAGVGIGTLARIKLVVARNRPLTRIMKIDDLRHCGWPGKRDEEASDFNYPFHINNWNWAGLSCSDVRRLR